MRVRAISMLVVDNKRVRAGQETELPDAEFNEATMEPLEECDIKAVAERKRLGKVGVIREQIKKLQEELKKLEGKT